MGEACMWGRANVYAANAMPSQWLVYAMNVRYSLRDHQLLSCDVKAFLLLFVSSFCHQWTVLPCLWFSCPVGL